MFHGIAKVTLAASWTPAMAATRSPAPWPRYPPRRFGYPHSACSGSRRSTHRAGLRRLGYDPRELIGTPQWRPPVGLLLSSSGGRSRQAPRLRFSASSISGSRLHHWLPTSPGCPCILRDEVPSLYPTTGSTFPMDVGHSVAGCAVRVIRRLGRFFEELCRTPSTRSSQKAPSSTTSLGRRSPVDG